MGLRARLLVVVGLVSLPLLVAVVVMTVSSGRRATADARRGGERLVRTVASEERNIVERGRHLLVALGELPIVRRGASAECDALFARLLAEYRVYTTLGVTAADGRIVCSAPAAPPGATLADRPIFQRMRAEPRFTIGVYAVGRLSGKPSLGLAYPMKDASGRWPG